MKNKINKNKILIILFVTLLGMALGSLIHIATNQPFLFGKNDRFMDFFNTLRVSKDVYSGVGTGRGYFPFSYLVLNIINFFSNNICISYYIAVILVFICMLLFLQKFFKEWELVFMLFIMFFSYPIIFAFDRGNIEGLVFALIILFFICYKKERYKAAAILLALPICMKLYPAVFILLFLLKKKIKEFLICVAACVLVMSISYWSIGGTINTLPIAIENFNYFNNTYALTGAGIQYSHTIWSGMNFLNMVFNNTIFNGSCMTVYTGIIAILALGLAYYIIFIEKEEWKAITILTIMMITFPHVSFDYTLIHMYIPIVFFVISENTKKWESIVYSILLGFTIIPMNWFQTINKGITLNLGLILRPMVLVSIILIVITTTIKMQIKNKQNVKGL